jgi:squalene-hopene/tetraprenyl-beta-curcumene cyclase
LKVLAKIQPESGGYLEAMPLTSFVAMALAATGKAHHTVVQRCLQFLRDTFRSDGSWPIDTNLATWNTTLSIVALREDASESVIAACQRALPWLLSCQFTRRHPYTGAEPGGWGWSSLSGAVPDADDTAGALLALDLLRERAAPDQLQRIATVGAAGARWLLRLQNRDGGWPTFCRGWGQLPFDRSGTDLTAHAIRALARWSDQMNSGAIDRTLRRAWSYLRKHQHEDGSWTPLWFGNQLHPAEENPLYGTAKVLLAYRDLGRSSSAADRAVAWLLSRQNEDGGWGARPPNPKAPDPHDQKSPGALRGRGASTVEETALVVEALLAHAGKEPVQASLERGIGWLIQAVDSRSYLSGSPIGLYFAKLWYEESTYPLVFSVSALAEACRACAGQAVNGGTRHRGGPAMVCDTKALKTNSPNSAKSMTHPRRRR